MSAPAHRPKALFILNSETRNDIFGPEQYREIEALAEVIAAPQTASSILAQPDLLGEIEIIFSAWGAPLMDEKFLALAPKLRAVFYAAGSIRSFTTPAFWERGIVLANAASANALPVAEYALGAILLSLKKFWSFAAAARAGEPWGNSARVVPGAFRSTVGLISLGMIGRRVAQLLQAFEVNLLAYCPFLEAGEASALGIERCTLAELFARADVISLHTPELPSTRGMITGDLFFSMKRDATFINTARGAIVREQEMIAVLRQRSDLTAVLDVTDPEPPAPESALLRLPNVVLTPHIAGSLGRECRRMGQYMVEDFKRYLAGQPLAYQVNKEVAVHQA